MNSNLKNHSFVRLRDSEEADIPGFTFRFGPDLSFLIEQNRRRSRATSRIL